jgi:hypothetical protein
LSWLPPARRAYAPEGKPLTPIINYSLNGIEFFGVSYEKRITGKGERLLGRRAEELGYRSKTPQKLMSSVH